MQIAQEQQGYFTTRQANEAGYADNTHPTMSAREIGCGFNAAFTGRLICRRPMMDSRLLTFSEHAGGMRSRRAVNENYSSEAHLTLRRKVVVDRTRLKFKLR